MDIWMNAVRASAPAAGGFDVLALSPSLWLKAAHITGLSNTDPVATWADASGNGYDVAQVTGSMQPLWIASAVGGKPAVRFDGTNDLLVRTASGTGAISGATAFELWIVMLQASNVAAAYPFALFDGEPRVIFGMEGGAALLDHTDYGAHRATGSLPAGWAGNWHIVRAHRDGADSEIIIDGATIATKSGLSNTWSSDKPLSVGGLHNVASYGAYNGDIAEIITFNRALDSTERAGMTAYLQSEYSL